MSNIFKRAGASLLDYARRAVTNIFINLMFGMTMFAVAAIEIAELVIILTYALLILAFIASFILMRGMGESAYKMKVAGDRLRSGLTSGLPPEKGADKYSPAKEYRDYKGFVIGFVVCLIPIVFVIVDVCTHSGGARLAYAMVAGWAFWPALAISQNASLLFTLIPCAVQIAVAGVGYIMGGNKEKLRQFALEQRAESVSRSKGAKKR